MAALTSMGVRYRIAERPDAIRCRRCGATDFECGHVPPLAPKPVRFRSHTARVAIYEWRAEAGFAVFHPDDDHDGTQVEPHHLIHDGERADSEPRILRDPQPLRQRETFF